MKTKHSSQVKASWREASKAIADLTISHRRETVALAANYVMAQEAIGEAVKLIDWLRGAGVGCWTPANTVKLEEWRALATSTSMPYRGTVESKVRL